MEIAWLEVSTYKHLNRMQETAKINYIQYGRGSKTKGRPKPRPSGSSSSNGGSDGTVNTANTRNPTKSTEKVGRLHYLMIYVGGVENLDTRKVNHAKLQR